MTTSNAYEPRAASDVPWGRDREKRVLGGALRSWRRREHRKRALGIAVILVGLAIASRMVTREAAASDERVANEAADAAAGTGAEGASAYERGATLHRDATKREVDAARSPSVLLPNNMATRASRGSNGFAGTGGHGGGGTTGIGGRAGTG